MKKTVWWMIGLIMVVGVVCGNSRAYALPTIDGILSLGEWDSFNLQGFDPNEAAIPNSYDLSEMRMILASSGGASDGVYALLRTYAAPSLVDTGIGPPPALVSLLLDSNGDADFSDSVDFFTEHKLTGFTVFDGTGSSILSGVDGTHFKLGSVIEYYIPSSVLSGFPYSGAISTFALYDNGGDAPDDRLPDAGFVTPIPEPGTMVLLGSGLLSLLGLAKVKLFA